MQIGVMVDAEGSSGASDKTAPDDSGVIAPSDAGADEQAAVPVEPKVGSDKDAAEDSSRLDSSAVVETAGAEKESVEELDAANEIGGSAARHMEEQSASAQAEATAACGTEEVAEEVAEEIAEEAATESPPGTEDKRKEVKVEKSPTWADEVDLPEDDADMLKAFGGDISQLCGGLDSSYFDEVAEFEATPITPRDRTEVAKERGKGGVAAASSKGKGSLERKDSAYSSGEEAAGSGGKDAGKGILSVQKMRRELNLVLKHRNLGPDQLRAILAGPLRRAIREKLRVLHGNADYFYINVDLSENDLGAEGAGILVDFLRRLHQGEEGKGDKGKHSAPICVKALRLFKNRLGDGGARHVAELIMEQSKPLIEVHLSHNGISSVGAATILLAFGSCRHRLYPFRLPHKSHNWGACWLRLERNDVEAPEALLAAITGNGVHCLETTWSQREWGPGRSPHWATSAQHVPHVVLHIFSSQGGKVSPSHASGWHMQHYSKGAVATCREHAKVATAVLAELTAKRREADGGKGSPTKKGAKKADSSEAAAAPSAASNGQVVEAVTVKAEEADAEPTERRSQKKDLVWKPKEPAPTLPVAPTTASAPAAPIVPGASASSSSKPSSPKLEAAQRPSDDAAEVSSGQQPSSGSREPKGKGPRADLDRAVSNVKALLQPGTGGDVLERWQNHLAKHPDPEHEARRISGMAQALRQQGFPSQGFWADRDPVVSSNSKKGSSAGGATSSSSGTNGARVAAPQHGGGYRSGQQAGAMLLQSLKAGFPGGKASSGKGSIAPQKAVEGLPVAKRTPAKGGGRTGGTSHTAAGGTVEQVEAELRHGKPGSPEGGTSSPTPGMLESLQNLMCPTPVAATSPPAVGSAGVAIATRVTAGAPAASAIPPSMAVPSSRVMASREELHSGDSVAIAGIADGSGKKKGKNKIGTWQGSETAPPSGAARASGPSGATARTAAPGPGRTSPPEAAAPAVFSAVVYQ